MLELPRRSWSTTWARSVRPAEPDPLHLAGQPMEQAGLDAMPIVGLLSFLIGVVHRLSGRRPAAPLRRRDLHRQSGRHLGPARARRAADRDHRRRPLGQRLHRPDRHDAGERGDRRACAPSGLDPIEVLVLPRVLALMIVAAAADLLSPTSWACSAAALMAMAPLDISLDAASSTSCTSAIDLMDLLGRHHQGAGLRLHHRHGRLLRGHARSRGSAESVGRLHHPVGGRGDLPGDRRSTRSFSILFSYLGI